MMTIKECLYYNGVDPNKYNWEEYVVAMRVSNIGETYDAVIMNEGETQARALKLMSLEDVVDEENSQLMVMTLEQWNVMSNSLLTNIFKARDNGTIR